MTIKISFQEELTKSNVSKEFKRVYELLKSFSSDEGKGEVIFDLSKLEKLDSAGVSLLVYFENRFKKKGGLVKIVGIKDELKDVYDLYAVDVSKLENKITLPEKVSLFEATGEKAISFFAGIANFLVLFVDTFYFLPYSLFKKFKKRLPLITEEMIRIGSTSAGIIVFLSFLVGLTLALQSAIQLKQFGADIFLANLTGVAMMKEMGPLLAAILLAGRIGSSTASEIATRMITEEVDALKTMGIEPVEYIVVPKFVAITITGPLLTILAIIVGILGGYLVGVFYLDLSSSMFITQLLKSLSIKDYLQGIVKSIAFSWAIIFIGAYKGFSVKGGPLEVGNATTSSVVISIFSVIVLDSLFSFIFYLG